MLSPQNYEKSLFSSVGLKITYLSKRPLDSHVRSLFRLSSQPTKGAEHAQTAGIDKLQLTLGSR